MHNYIWVMLSIFVVIHPHTSCVIFLHTLIECVRLLQNIHLTPQSEPRTNLTQKSNSNLSFCWLTHYTQMGINVVGTWVLINNTFIKSSTVHIVIYMPKIQQNTHELCLGCSDCLECEWSPFAAKRWQKWGPINFELSWMDPLFHPTDVVLDPSSPPGRLVVINHFIIQSSTLSFLVGGRQ